MHHLCLLKASSAASAFFECGIDRRHLNVLKEQQRSLASAFFQPVIDMHHLNVL